jgi:DNA-binding transcriptional ArsR family regulator
MRQPHLSQHLARLRRDVLVGTRRDSRTIYYRLNNSAAAQVIRLLYRLYCAPRIARDRGIVRASARTTGQDGQARSAAAASRGEARTRRALIKEGTRRPPSRPRRRRQAPRPR